MLVQETTKKARIALDGPSALMLYRDRDDVRGGEVLWYVSTSKGSTQKRTVPRRAIGSVVADESTGGEANEEDFWLSDEDLAATLAESSVFGKRAKTVSRMVEEPSSELVSFSRSRVRSLGKCSARRRDIIAARLEVLGVRRATEESPLYLMVRDAASRRVVKNTRVRTCSSLLPDNSLRLLGDWVLVPSPELVFLLLASHVSLIQLIVIGMELCGYYRLEGASTSNLLRSSRTLYNQRPLTTPDRIMKLLQRSKGITGRSKAMRACKYVEAGSASPMETASYLLLCLPRMLGGYGFGRPILNVKRAVNTKAESLTMASYLIPDLYWPQAALDVEYDSDEFHADPNSLRNGARRTLALRVMKVEVLTLTHELVCDADAFDAIAHTIGKRLGKRIPRETPQFRQQRSELRKTVLI